MGPIGQIMGMIPGMGNMAGEAQAAVDRGDLKRTEAIIRAMTPAERRDPTVLNALAPPPHRGRLGHDPAGRQPARQAIQRDAEAHEAAFRRRPARCARQPHGGPALGAGGRPRDDRLRPTRPRPDDPTDRVDRGRARRPIADAATSAAPSPTRRPQPPPGRAAADARAEPAALARRRAARRADRRRHGLRDAVADRLVADARPSLGYVPADSVVYGELRLDLPGDQRQKVGAVPVASSRASPTRPRSRPSSTRCSTGSSSEGTDGKQTFTATSSPGSTASSRSRSAPLPTTSAPDTGRTDSRGPSLLLSIKDEAAGARLVHRRHRQVRRHRHGRDYEGIELTVFNDPRRPSPQGRLRPGRRQGRRRRRRRLGQGRHRHQGRQRAGQGRGLRRRTGRAQGRPPRLRVHRHQAPHRSRR